MDCKPLGEYAAQKRGVQSCIPHFRTTETEKRGGSPAALGWHHLHTASQCPALPSLAPHQNLAPPLAPDFILMPSLHSKFTILCFIPPGQFQQNGCGPTEVNHTKQSLCNISHLPGGNPRPAWKVIFLKNYTEDREEPFE